MEISSRRSNYSHLSQVDDDQGASFYDPVAGEPKVNNKAKVVERGFDCEPSGDHYANQIGNFGNMYAPSSFGLQRQSSGSSYGESSLSGEYYAPSLSASTVEAEIEGMSDDAIAIRESE